MDFVLQLIIEALIQRNAEEEKRLKQVYIDGDTDGDGVLSFEEFKSNSPFLCLNFRVQFFFYHFFCSLFFLCDLHITNLFFSWFVLTTIYTVFWPFIGIISNSNHTSYILLLHFVFRTFNNMQYNLHSFFISDFTPIHLYFSI